MKKREKIKIEVEKVYEEQKLVIANAEGNELVAKVDMEHIYPKDKLILFGNYQRNKVMGKYFEADFIREDIEEELWIAKWLKINKKMSDRDIIKLLIEGKGREKVWSDYENLLKVNKIMEYLIKKKVSEETISQIEKKYRWNRAKIIKNPYLLLEHVDISYETIQKIIKKFECEEPVSEKGNYLLWQLLLQANQKGHFYLPLGKVRKFLLKNAVVYDEMLLSEKFIVESEKVYLKNHYEIEKNITENILKRLEVKEETKEEGLVESWEKETGFTLANNQKEAVKMALKEKFCVVTGGPGVGKTTVCKCITDLLGKNASITMAAPTGRAAKRARESTGLPTSTVHRLLEYNGYKFFRNENNPIETDVLVIDESSMIDAPLLLALLKSTPNNTKVIFVGDVDQLPSVGPGQILRDFIESNVIPVTRLTEIFRQAADSPIITCAYAVNRGEMPELISKPDLEYKEFEKDEGVLKETIEIAKKLYQENDIFDVQILIPMYKGTVGIDEVNKHLQNHLNKGKPTVKVDHYEIRLGDKVIQTKNDYQKGIYNGDVGVVTFCSREIIKVHFQGEENEVEYKPEEFNTLQLSYAVTVHRAQGSEYKYAVIPVALSHGRMLQKNLLYTAITRSKKKLWILYQKEALEKSVSLDSVPKRYTTISEFLRKKQTS